MISGKEIKVVDINSEFYGIPAINLMENAGKKAAFYIREIIKTKDKTINIFCGTGNNGGDGFVLARYLSKDYKIKVILIGMAEY